VTIPNLIRRLVINRPLTAADHDANLNAIEIAVDAKATAANLATIATSGSYGDLTGQPTLGTAASRDVPATGDASAIQVVLGGDSRLSNSREWSAATVTQVQAEVGTSTGRVAFTPQRVFQAIAAWWQANSTAVGRAVTTATTQADGRTALGLGSAATAETTDFVAAGALAAPGPIGGTTPAAGTFTALAASSSQLLPAAAPGIPAAGHVYRVGDQIRYRDSTAGEQVLLYGGGNLANLNNKVTARANLDLTPGGGLSIQSGTLVTIDHIALVCTNNDETGTTGSNRAEKRIHRAFTVIGCYWECATTGSTSSQAMPYLRPSSTGTKASLLTGNAVLAASAGYIDVSANLTGTLTGVAGDSVGVDLNAVGTGAKGHIFTIVVRYS
jgi:hypothetical protein